MPLMIMTDLENRATYHIVLPIRSMAYRKVTSSKYVEDDGGEAEQDQKMAEVEGEADDMADAPGEPDDGQHIGKSTHLR